jgi:hypothetical protein
MMFPRRRMAVLIGLGVTLAALAFFVDPIGAQEEGPTTVSNETCLESFGCTSNRTCSTGLFTANSAMRVSNAIRT